MPMQEGREEKNNNNKEGKAELGDTEKVLSTKIQLTGKKNHEKDHILSQLINMLKL